MTYMRVDLICLVAAILKKAAPFLIYFSDFSPGKDCSLNFQSILTRTLGILAHLLRTVSLIFCVSEVMKDILWVPLPSNSGK